MRAGKKGRTPVAQANFDEMLEAVSPGAQNAGAHHAHPPEKKGHATKKINDNERAWVQFISF